MGHKNGKGTVSITVYKERIRLRWRYCSKRFSVNLSAATELNMLQAKKLALQIEQDLILGSFDETLFKYNGKQTANSNKGKSFAENFEYWVKNYRQRDCDLHTDYNSTRSMVRKWGRVDASNVVKKLNSETNVAVTFNRRLSILKSFIDWLVEYKIWEVNPLASVQRKRIKAKKLTTREPFTLEEISRILEAFRTNSVCSPYSNTKHDRYFPFVFFLFKTGVRNAEAIGLRVKHVDFTANLIHIKEVLARTLKSTGAHNRVRKSTKNEKERVLPLTQDLATILKPLVEKRGPDELVFVSPQKKSMDDENFRKRVFYPVLDKLGIRRRVIYACRHTFGSRCIDAGLTPVATAFLLGNSPQTALKRYTHQLSIPDVLPML
jgi:integrase